mmetsp:Transcript_5046/g.7445  ORF Transcript_5046/g.7445 Transcript_5046/m.7445 type:complete len:237 (-) Transcript_5046:985-1695(-)
MSDENSTYVFKLCKTSMAQGTFRFRIIVSLLSIFAGIACGFFLEDYEEIIEGDMMSYEAHPRGNVPIDDEIFYPTMDITNPEGNVDIIRFVKAAEHGECWKVANRRCMWGRHHNILTVRMEQSKLSLSSIAFSLRSMSNLAGYLCAKVALRPLHKAVANADTSLKWADLFKISSLQNTNEPVFVVKDGENMMRRDGKKRRTKKKNMLIADFHAIDRLVDVQKNCSWAIGVRKNGSK